MTKNDSALMFICSLIEYIGRRQKLSGGDVVKALGVKNIARIYKNYYSDFFYQPRDYIKECYIAGEIL